MCPREPRQTQGCSLKEKSKLKNKLYICATRLSSHLEHFHNVETAISYFSFHSIQELFRCPEANSLRLFQDLNTLWEQAAAVCDGNENLLMMKKIKNCLNSPPGTLLLILRAAFPGGFGQDSPLKVNSIWLISHLLRKQQPDQDGTNTNKKTVIWFDLEMPCNERVWALRLCFWCLLTHEMWALCEQDTKMKRNRSLRSAESRHEPEEAASDWRWTSRLSNWLSVWLNPPQTAAGVH